MFAGRDKPPYSGYYFGREYGLFRTRKKVSRPKCGLPKERTYVTGSPMAEVLHKNLEKIENSDILTKLGLEKKVYSSVGSQRENIDTEKNFNNLFSAINGLAENMICRYPIRVIRVQKNASRRAALSLTRELFATSRSDFTITIIFR